MLKVSRRWHWTRHFISRSKRKPTWSQLPFRQRAWCLPWIALRCCGLLPSLRLDIASMPRRLPPHPLKKNNLQLPDTNTKNKRKEGGGKRSRFGPGARGVISGPVVIRRTGLCVRVVASPPLRGLDWQGCVQVHASSVSFAQSASGGQQGGVARPANRAYTMTKPRPHRSYTCH